MVARAVEDDETGVMTMVVVLAGLPLGVGVCLLEMMRVVVSGWEEVWDLMRMLSEGARGRRTLWSGEAMAWEWEVVAL